MIRWTNFLRSPPTFTEIPGVSRFPRLHLRTGRKSRLFWQRRVQGAHGLRIIARYRMWDEFARWYRRSCYTFDTNSTPMAKYRVLFRTGDTRRFDNSTIGAVLTPLIAARLVSLALFVVRRQARLGNEYFLPMYLQSVFHRVITKHCGCKGVFLICRHTVRVNPRGKKIFGWTIRWMWLHFRGTSCS